MAWGFKEIGNKLSSGLTGGAFSTSGKGWAQGGSASDVLNDFAWGIPGAISKANEVPVPAAMARPEWNLSTPDGKLRPDLLLGNQAPKAMGQSQGALDELLAQAKGVGPTKSAQYLMDANKRNTMNSLDTGNAMMRSGVADASNTLAMRGGSDAGSRARMMKGATFENMLNRQRTLNDSAGNNLEILAKDEAQKQQTLQALPASLLAQAGFEQGRKQFDIQNTLGTVGGKYGEDMRAWAANQSAREQAMLANKDKGLLGLGIGGL